MKSFRLVVFSLIPIVSAALYVFGVWRSWRLGKYERGRRRPILLACCLCIAAVACGALARVRLALLLGGIAN